MGIEDQLDRLAEAVEANTAAVLKAAGKSAAQATQEGKGKPGRPAGSKNKPAEEENEDDDADDGDGDGLDDDDEDQEEDELTQETLRPLFVKLKKEVGDDAVKKILKELKAKSFVDITKDKLATAKKLVQKAIKAG